MKAVMRCIVENCADEVIYPRLGLCAACYAGIYYWKTRNRSVAAHVRCLSRTRRLVSRHEMMLKGRSNVRVLKTTAYARSHS